MSKDKSWSLTKHLGKYDRDIGIMFKRTEGNFWPTNSRGGMNQITRIYTEACEGTCVCGKEATVHQIIMRDPVVKNSKVTLFACDTCGSEFVSAVNSWADLRQARWENGWEIACDFCLEDCERPNFHTYTPKYIGAGMSARFRAVICDDCETLEALFA